MPVGIAAVLNALEWIYLAIAIAPTEELLILHYTAEFGVDFLGSWKSVFVVPAIGLLFLIVNTTVSWWFWQRVRVLSYVVNIVSFIISAIMAGVSILLAALNT